MKMYRKEKYSLQKIILFIELFVNVNSLSF